MWPPGPDIAGDDLVAAARLFASGRVGSVTAGTGPNMAPRGTLTEYLIAAIQTVCGRWLREGEPLPNPYVLLPRREARAQADPPVPSHGYGEQLRIRGLGDNAGGMPTAALAEEILLEGDGQVRALFSVGGNPVAAWPDQLKAIEAMESLDLNVTLDIKMSATAKDVPLRHRPEAVARGGRYHHAERGHLGLRRCHHGVSGTVRAVRAGDRRSTRRRRGDRGVAVLLPPRRGDGPAAPFRRRGSRHGPRAPTPTSSSTSCCATPASRSTRSGAIPTAPCSPIPPP
jgi:hypothetical protein